MYYVSREFVDTYLSIDPNVSTKWNALSDTDKDNLILNSELYIDMVPGYRWIGNKVDASQISEFPRDWMSYVQSTDKWDYMTDFDRQYYIDNNLSIPIELKHGVIEFIRMLPNLGQFGRFAQMQAENVESFKADVVSFNFDLDKRWTEPLPKRCFMQVYRFFTTRFETSKSGYSTIIQERY